MPYIPDHKRREEVVERFDPRTKGELNFLMYYLSLEYITRNLERYDHFDDVVNAYENAHPSPIMHSVFDVPYDRSSELLKKRNPITSNELSLMFCNVLYEYCQRTGAHDRDVRGTVRASQSEFIRRHMDSYEDKKIKENGDVVLFN